MVIPTATLSADSGAKTRLGLGETLSPSGELYSTGIGIKAINPRGLGTESPDKLPPMQVIRFVRSAHFQIPIFRRTHVSAFNFCKSLFRW
jgi:hypothetical protein